MGGESGFGFPVFGIFGIFEMKVLNVRRLR
jgi:hypothetical protein